MNWFELGYIIGILVAVSLIFYFLTKQRGHDNQHRKDIKEGKAKRSWRDMP